MAIIRDQKNIDIETLIEFTRKGVALNVERFMQTQGPGATVFDKVLAGLEPSILQDDSDGNLLRDQNFLFCDPKVLAQDKTECPTCIPDPNAFVPDWRASPDGLVFFDKSKCNYSVVVETDVFNIPQRGERTLFSYTELGVQRLIEFYNKTETITAVVYKPYPTYDDLRPKTRTAEERAEISLNENRAVAFIKEFVSGKATDPFTLLALPPKKFGFERILEEFTTLDQLMPIAMEKVKKFVSTTRNVHTKLLVSIPAEVFDKIPNKTRSEQPSVESYESDMEITISGEDYVDIFYDVARNLNRARIYLNNLMEETDGSKLYPALGGEDAQPVYIDFKQKVKDLKDFKKIIDSAMGSAANIASTNLEKIIFNFNADPNTRKITIAEVTVKRYGCPLVILSQYRNSDREVKTLFDYNDSIVLGYVAALSDMIAFLEKTKEETKWDDFILKFTYPGYVLRDIEGNIVDDEDPECLGSMSLNGIVNKLIDGIEDFGSMFYNAAIKEICIPQSDLADYREARREIREETTNAIAQHYARNGYNPEEYQRISKLPYNQALKRLEKEKKKLDAAYRDSTSSDGNTADEAYKTHIRMLDEAIQIITEQKSKAAAQKPEIKADKKAKFKEKFIKSRDNKIKNAKRGQLSNRPLAQKILELMFPGTKEPSGNREKQKLDQILDGINKGGGWCAWVALIFEAMSCILQGMGIEDAQKAIAKAVLKSLSPVKLQILLRNLPPELSGKIIETITKNSPEIFPEAFDNPGNGSWTNVHGDSIVKSFIKLLPDFASGDYITNSDTGEIIYVAEVRDSSGNLKTSNYKPKEWSVTLKRDDSSEITINQNSKITLPEQKTKNALLNNNNGIVLVVDGNEVTLDPNDENYKLFLDQATREASSNRAAAVQARLDAGWIGRTEAQSLGRIQADIMNQLVDTIIETVGVNQLFAILEDIPGIRLAKKFVKDIQCVLPGKIYTNPRLDSFLSTFRFDVCNIPKGKSVEIKLPKFKQIRISRNMFLKLWEALGEALLDVFTQILVNLLIKIIETILDLACNALGALGAYLAELATGNQRLRDQLKQSICPNDPVSDSAFAEGLKNVLDGLYGQNPEQQNCASSLTSQDMAAFMDAVLVTLNYGEFYDLVLGNASPTVLTTVAAVARGLGNDCISSIFGDPKNIENYFKGLGVLTNASTLLDEIPPDVQFSENSYLCPPENAKTIRDFREKILTEKGLSPEEIQEQLDFLKDQAVKKLEDLATLLNTGPYASEISDIYSENPEDPCNPNGLMLMDPFMDGALKTSNETVFSSIETQLMQDLIGFNGVMNHVLSDTFGRKYSIHQFYIGFFGNSIGQANHLLTEFYSDNSIRFSYIEGDKLITLDKKDSSIDQYGLRIPDGRNERAPRGGFPPTIGAYLMNKFQNNKIGYLDPGSIVAQEQDFKNIGNPVKFETRRALRDGEIQNYRMVKIFNENLIRRRRERVAKFCIATGFIDAESSQPYIPQEMTPETLEATAYIKTQREYINRLGTFNDLMSACAKPLFSSASDRGYPIFSAEARVERILGQRKNPELREINYNGRIYGLSSTRKDKLKNSLRKGNYPDTIDTIGTGDGSGKLTYTKEMMEFYLECWFAYPENGDKESSEEFYKPFLISDLHPSTYPDQSLDPLPYVNPFELGFSYLSYRKLKGNKKNQPLSLPEYGFDLTYNINLEDDEGYLLPEKKGHYRVTLIERLNPFVMVSSGLSASDKRALEIYYSDLLDNAKGMNPNSKDDDDLASLESDGLVPFTGDATVIKFVHESKGTYPTDVEKYLETLDKNVIFNASEIKYSYQAELLKEFFIDISFLNNEKISGLFLPYYGNSPGLIDRLVPGNTIAERKLNYADRSNLGSNPDFDFITSHMNDPEIKRIISNYFDYINEGFNRRIAKRIGVGDGSETIPEWDVIDNPNNKPGNIESYLNPPAPTRLVPVPKGFRFGYDPLKQPEYIILNHEKYGLGSEENPPFYLKPPSFTGWLGIMQKLFPEKDACDPRRKPIYELDDIEQEVTQLARRLMQDERLGFDPICTKESPYDSIFESMNLATMDGIIRATARVYILDTVLRTIPILSEFQLNSDKNFDEIFFIYMAERALDNIKRADVKRIAPPTVKNVQEVADSNPPMFLFLDDRMPYMNYYYGILEQATNIILRKIDSGIITMDELDASQKEAVLKIRKEIDDYYIKYNGTEAVLSEEAIRAQSILSSAFNGKKLRDIGLKLGSTGFNKFRAKKIKKAINYAVLRRTEKEAKIMFSIYMKQEFNALSKKLQPILEPKVEDLDYLFLGSPDFINGNIEILKNQDGLDVKDDYGRPIIQGAFDVSGDVNDSLRNNIIIKKDDTISGLYNSANPDTSDTNIDNTTQKLQGSKNGESTVSTSNYKTPSRSWPFVLEKYILIEDKPYGEFLNKNVDLRIVNQIINRDERLKGVVNLQDWNVYIKDLLANNPDITGNISDYWGPGVTEVETDPTSPNYGKEFIKNTGWKLGLRLSIIIDPRDPEYKIFSPVVERITQENRQKNKAYKISTQQGEKLLIPLAVGELDFKDDLPSSFNPKDYDYYCLINELRNSLEFKTLFKYFFPYRRYLSLQTIFFANAFFDSIGNAGAPSEGGDRWSIPNGKRGTTFKKWEKEYIFHDQGEPNGDTARSLMNTFMMSYRLPASMKKQGRRNKRKFDVDFGSIMKNFAIDASLFSMPSTFRRYRLERPYDMFDGECIDFDERDEEDDY